MPDSRRTVRIFSYTVWIISIAGMAWAAAIPAYRTVFTASALVSGLATVFLWKQKELPVVRLLLLAGFARLAVFYLEPGLSDDIYRYIWDGILTVNGINPFHFVPSDPTLALFQREPIYRLVNSAEFFSVYPPVSQMFFLVGGWLYAGDWHVSYYAIKALIMCTEFGGLAILASRIGSRSLLLLALHPVVILASAGQSHTDALLILFLGVGALAARKGNGLQAATMLTLAGWVKLYPFFLLPLVWRRFGWKTVALSLLVGSAVAIPFFAPYVMENVRTSLDLYVRYFEFNAGFYYGLKKLFRIATGDDWSKQLGPALQMVFFIGLAVIYWLDRRNEWTFIRSSLYVVGLMILTATTMHPWYFTGILVLISVNGRPSWHWQWVSLLSIGTYLLYTGGPYWTFVVVGWTGFAAVYVIAHADPIFQAMQRIRSAFKARDIVRLFHPTGSSSILDLGAGEGYVGAYIHRHTGAEVHLMDVVDMHRVPLELTVYDGHTIPLETNSVDYTILYFVLHHTENPRGVLAEALRVSRKSVIVVESVYDNPLEERLLYFLDPLFNRLRSHGLMTVQEEYLCFRSARAWEVLFDEVGAELVRRADKYHPAHRKAYFVVR